MTEKLFTGTLNKSQNKTNKTYFASIHLFRKMVFSISIHSHIVAYILIYKLIDLVLGGTVGRVSAPRPGGTGFDPGPQHNKNVNNDTCCSPLGRPCVRICDRDGIKERDLIPHLGST